MISRFSWRNLHLATQLAILLAVMAIIPLVLVTLYNETVHQDELLKTAHGRNALQARNAAADLDQYLNDTLADVHVLSVMPAAIKLLRDEENVTARDEMSAILRETRQTHNYSAILLASQTGKVILSTAPNLAGTSYLTAPAFRTATAGNTSFDEPRYDPLTGEAFLHFSAPVRDLDGTILGAMIGRLPMSTFDQLARSRLELVGNDNFGLLWTENGILLSNTQHPESRFRPLVPLMPDVADRLIIEERYGPATRDLLAHSLDAPQIAERGRELLYDANADPSLVVTLSDTGIVHGAVAPLHAKRWVYGVFLAERYILAELNAQTTRTLQIALLVGLLALLCGIVGARWWLLPLRRVTDTANALAAGELTRRVGLTERDELGQLSVTFDTMADALMEQDRQLREHASQLETRVAERTAELSASEERYRSLVQVSPDAISLISMDRQVIFCNSQLAQVHGFARAEEMIGLDVLELVAPADRERMVNISRELLATGQTATQEFTLLRKDGTSFPAELRWSIIPALKLEEVTVIGITRDISERKRAEAEIRRHAAYQTALNTIITAAVESGNDLDAMLNTTLDQIVSALNVPMAGAWVLDDMGQIQAIAIRGMAIGLDRIGRHMSLLNKHNQDFRAVVSDWSQYQDDFGQGMRELGIRASVLVPLSVQGKVTGGMAIAQAQPYTWNEHELAFIRTIAHQLGMVIERVHLYDEAVSRAEQFGLLYQAGLTVNGSLDMREQLKVLCKTAMQAVHAEHAGIFLYHPATQDLRFEFGVGPQWDMTEMRGWSFRLGEERGIVGWVAQTREIYYVPDVDQEPHWVKSVVPVRSALWISLAHEATLQGVIVVTSFALNAFNAQDQKLLTLFANQISIAMDNAQLYANAVRAAERRAVLHRASQDVIAAGTDQERVYHAIHHAVAQLMPCEAFVIGLHDAAHAENVAVYLVDRDVRRPVLRAPSHRGLMGRVIPTGQAVLDNALPDSDTFLHFGERERVRSLVAVPLQNGGRTIGMLSAQSYQTHAYTNEDRELLEMLAANAASVLENARLFQETQHRLAALEALSRVSTALRAAKTLDQMTGVLLDETLVVLKAEAATIWLYDPGKDHLFLAAARGFPTDAVPLKPGEGIAGQVFTTGQVYLSPDFRADPQTSENHRELVPGGLRGAVVPIRIAQESIGVLFVSVQEPSSLNEDQVQLLTTLAEMAGNAIHRQRLHDQTQHRLEQVQALRAVDMAITSSMDLDVTLTVLVEHAITQLGMAGADILTFSPHLRLFQYFIGRGLRARFGSQMNVRLGEGLAGQAALERRLVAIPDVPTYLAAQPDGLSDPFKTELVENINAYFAVPLIAKGQIQGILELFHSTPHDLDADRLNFLEAIANQAAIAMDNTQLFRDLERSNVELALAYDTTIEGWSRTLDLRDEETEGHTQRVTELTVQLARAMGMNDAELIDVRRGALLHDIGKMGVPDRILLKPGPLTEDEWAQMRRHPFYAYELLLPIKFLGRAIDIPYCHHEHWDGTGYPRGLSGEQIPLTARIFTVADVWDALTSDRPYRAAWTPEHTRDYMLSMSGKQFDPQVVTALLRLLGL